MKRALPYGAVALAGLAVAALPRLARSADALDGADVSSDPDFDIADFYAWVDNGGGLDAGTDAGATKRVVFVLNVDPGAESGAIFPANAQYVVHTSSVATFGADAGAAAVEDIIATFDATQKISLWVGTDEYVNGDASIETGLASADGKVRVYAGRRQDPFFFNQDGFDAARGALSTTLNLGTTTCPALDAGLVSSLQTSLRTTDGGTAIDAFASATVLSIVVSLDPSLVTKGGSLVSAWASTHTAVSP